MKNYPFLNDIETTLVQAFFNNEAQREAVRKVLLNGIFEQGALKAGVTHNPLHNWALTYATKDELSNEQIGADLRATAQGLVFVERAFADLANIKTPDTIIKKKNPGR